MSTHFTQSVARIWGVKGNVVGTGFAVLGRYVVTCAHVVDDALGRSRGTVLLPEGELTVDLPFLSKTGLRARVVAWYPTRTLAERERDPVADIAVLDLGEGTALAASVRPEAVDRRTPAAGSRFLTYGYPKSFDGGLQADGEVQVLDAGGWLHVRDTQAYGHFIEPGFSGAGVFSIPGPREPRLIGMVTAADTDTDKRLAFILPSELICRAWPPLARPYRGLARFDEEEADLFFGRGAFVDELHGKLARSAFAAVVGPSGSGKSSVVMAGLVPRLRSEGWSVAECRPGRDPVYQLCYGLAPLLGAGAEDFTARSAAAEQWATALRKDPSRILDLAQKIGQIRGGGLLVFVDQFEELFTNDAGAPDGAVACPNETTDAYGSPRQAAFLKVLEAIAAQDPVGRLPIRAVATLRADFLAPALRIGALTRLLKDADVKLGPMSAADLNDAIRAPAARFGVAFEPGLAEEIVADMKGRSGGLPLLQFALDRLWHRQVDRQLTRAAYRGTDGRGGLETALNDHAEAVLARLGPEAEAGLRRVMLRLVRLGAPGTPDARAVATRAEIGEADWPLVQRLAQEEVWLVTIGTSAESGAETAEVMHEALIGAWTRLRAWLAEFRAFGLWRQRLQVDLERHVGSEASDTLLRGRTLAEATGWLATHAEQLNPAETQFITDSREHATREAASALDRQKRANRWLTVALVVFACVAGVAGWFYFQASEQSQRAEEQTRRAEAAATAAETAASAEAVARAEAEDAARRAEVAAAAEASARKDAESATVQARLDASRAEAATADANAQKAIAVTNETQALSALSRVAISEGRPIEAIKLGLSGWPRSRGDARPQFEASIINVSDAISQGRLPQHNLAHGSVVLGALALADGRILSWSRDNSLRLWDAAKGAQIGPPMAHDGSVNGALALADGRLLSWSWDGTLRLWDPATGMQIGPPMTHDDSVSGAIEMADGRILSWSLDNSLRLWDAAKGAQIGPPMAHDGSVRGALALADGRLLSWSEDNTLRLWDPATGSQIGPPMAHEAPVTGALEMSDGRILSWTDDALWSSFDDLSWSGGGGLQLWDHVTGARIGPPLMHAFTQGALQMADGRILSWSGDGTLRLWDPATGMQIGPPMTHDDSVSGAIEMADGRILSWSLDNSLRLWDPATGVQSGPAMAHDAPVADAFEMANGNILSWSSDALSWFGDGSLKLWDPVTGARIGPPMPHDASISGAIEMADGRILSWSNDSSFMIWDIVTGAQSGPSMFQNGGVLGSLEMADGSILSWTDNSLQLWDPVNGARKGPAMVHGGWFLGWIWDAVEGALEMSDGRILSWSEDYSLRLWDPASGAQIGPPMKHDGAVLGALEMADGRILSWSDDDSLRLWDAVTGAQIGPPMAHDAPVAGALEMSDGRILSWSDDDSLRLWDPVSATQIGPHMAHSGPVEGAIEMSDGSILSWSRDDSLQLWDSATGAQIGVSMMHDDVAAGAVGGALEMSDGRTLSWSEFTLRFWDPVTGAQIGVPMVHDDLAEGEIGGALEMEDGRILSWSDDSLRFWDPGTGAQRGPSMVHFGEELGALLLADGRIFSWSASGILKLWDPATGTQIGPPMVHHGPVLGALALADGRLLSWSEDNTLRLWNVNWPEGSIFQIACALLPDTGFQDVTSRYGVVIEDPICSDPAGIPLPDWRTIRRAP